MENFKKFSLMDETPSVATDSTGSNTVLSAVPLWTMVAEKTYNRTRYHIATDTFVSLCGLANLFVRDYIEYRNGEFKQIGESGQEWNINQKSLCKKCVRAWHSR